MFRQLETKRLFFKYNNIALKGIVTVFVSFVRYGWNNILQYRPILFVYLKVIFVLYNTLFLFLGHGKCVEFVKKYGMPFLMVGGGGYTIRNVSRCWTYETSVALGTEIANELPYNDYFEYFGPDFKLHISPSNMANQNTPEYLEKIK